MEEELLEFSWWWKSPIDFEHKKWKLYAYFSRMDKAFMEHNFSPWLLHSEKILDDMIASRDHMKSVQKMLERRVLVYNFGALYWKMEKPPQMEEIEIAEEILDYSIPLMDQKLKWGRSLWKKKPTLLWG
jgi:hypothetical protein